MHRVGRLSIGVVNTKHWTVSLDLKQTEASFSQNSIDSLSLRVAQVPTSREVAIFVLTTQPIALPLAHARGVIIITLSTV
jgi:hypothetical protein